MGMAQERSGRLHETRRRVAVLVVVTSCHLVLLMLVLRQVAFDSGVEPGVIDNSAVIKLRFFWPPRPFSSQAPLPKFSRSTPRLKLQTRLPKQTAAQSSIQRVIPVAMRPAEAYSTSSPNIRIPGQYWLHARNAGDGGFQQRLFDAKPSYGAPRLPGSDTPVVTGIELIDPIDQGVGGIIRKAQRLFGVKNSHCVDVDTWRSLTPQELSARYISPGDVDKTDKKYACNAPPGLRF